MSMEFPNFDKNEEKKQHPLAVGKERNQGEISDEYFKKLLKEKEEKEKKERKKKSQKKK